jgi:hypothetical protein
MPVNWLGNGHAFMLLSAAPDGTGGLYDGEGRQAVAFPDDGHPLLCYDAVDLDGDGRDELLCWDHRELWVYRADLPDSAGVGRRLRRYPPQRSASNYVACMLLED